MELELESMTEAYVLSLGEAQFDSCPLSTCHALRSALPDAAPSQSRLKALLKEVSNRARLWNVLLLFVGRSAAELSPAPSGLLHLRETGRGQDGSGEGTDHGSHRVPLRLRVFPVRLSLPSELPRHPSARQVLHHRGRDCPLQSEPLRGREGVSLPAGDVARRGPIGEVGPTGRG